MRAGAVRGARGSRSQAQPGERVPGGRAARRAPPSAPAGVRPDASPGALTDDFSQLSVFSLVSRAAGK